MGGGASVWFIGLVAQRLLNSEDFLLTITDHPTLFINHSILESILSQQIFI